MTLHTIFRNILLPLSLALPLALTAKPALAAGAPEAPGLAGTGTTGFCNALNGPICVGADAACHFTNLQDAIDAASATNTTILIANNQDYENQHLVIDNRNVTLSGGYTSCSAWVPTGKTILHGNVSHSVISIGADPGPAYAVELENLEIRDGGGTDPNGFHLYSLGGGVLIQGSVSVTINDSTIAQNAATYGGGIYMDGNDGAQLRLHGVEISNNSASNSAGHGTAHYSGRGGGIYCKNGGYIGTDAVDVLGNVAVADANGTAMGGGVYLSGCLFSTWPHTPGPFVNFLLNIAQDGDGGAIYVATQASHGGTVSLHGGVSLKSNIAGRDGGGLYADDAEISLGPVDIENNIAGFSGSGSGGGLYLRESRLDMNKACNGCGAYLEGNGSLSGNSASGPGTAIYGFASSSATNDIVVRIDNTRIVGNGAPGYSVIDVGSGPNSGIPAKLQLHNVLATGNSGTTLFKVRTPVAGELFVSSSTIAENVVNVDFAVGGDTLTHPPFWLYNSIVREAPGTYVAASMNNVDVKCVIAHDDNHLPADGTLVVVDPRFIDAVAGDYRLQPDSPAIDFCGHTGDVPDDDLDGNPRGVDALLVPPFLPGATFDLGAYEWTPGDDTIFADGFD